MVWDVTGRTSALAWRSREGSGSRRFSGEKPSDVLLPAIAGLMETCAEPLTHIGVVKGPGSFTGIRSGLALAMGFQAGLGIAALGFSKFDLLLRLAAGRACGLVIPGSKGEVYFAPCQAGSLTEAPSYRAIEDLPKGLVLLAIEPIVGLEIEPIFATYHELCLEAMSAKLDPAAYDLNPLYIKAADTRIGQPLIERLLAGLE